MSDQLPSVVDVMRLAPGYRSAGGILHVLKAERDLRSAIERLHAAASLREDGRDENAGASADASADSERLDWFDTQRDEIEVDCRYAPDSVGIRVQRFGHEWHWCNVGGIRAALDLIRASGNAGEVPAASATPEVIPPSPRTTE